MTEKLLVILNHSINIVLLKLKRKYMILKMLLIFLKIKQHNNYTQKQFKLMKMTMNQFQLKRNLDKLLKMETI